MKMFLQVLPCIPIELQDFIRTTGLQNHTLDLLIWDSNVQSRFFFNFLFYTGVKSIYNVMLDSGVQQSDSVIYTHGPIFFKSFFHLGCYIILSRVPCAI